MKVRTVVKRLEVTIERDGKRVAQMRMVSGEGAGADLVEAMTSLFIGPPSPEATPPALPRRSRKRKS
jgi:hypothetical protein